MHAGHSPIPGPGDGLSRMVARQLRCVGLDSEALHQRVPLVFGSRGKVERVARYHAEPPAARQRSPLFGERGLFQASR